MIDMEMNGNGEEGAGSGVVLHDVDVKLLEKEIR